MGLGLSEGELYAMLIDGMDDIFKEKCPYMRTIQARDKTGEMGDESRGYCDLMNHWCVLIGGYECEVYQDFLDDIKDE